MKRNLMIVLIALAVILICLAPLIIGTMANSYDDMNRTVNETNPAHVGVTVGGSVTAGVSGLMWVAIILLLGAAAMIAIWMFTKAAGGK